MDAWNRYRFKDDARVLGGCITASQVFARPGGTEAAVTPDSAPVPGGEIGGTPEADGEVRPAA